MDAVEVARKAAAELHRQCTQRADPTKPYAFVLEAARLSGLDVDEVPLGSSQLDGGRAKLIHKDDLIIHEAAATEFEKAFLVAHEIGHKSCGDGGEDDIVPGIDPARSAEQPRCAAEQIVDYGRRQRREVQMDLFAREFLLPRSLVRSLHVEKGLTASEISTCYKMPFPVVAQQIFDALLLPEAAAQAVQGTDRPPPQEDELQKLAATHLGGPFLLEAGPGTGKTRTLVDRVAFLLERGVDPRKILVLTFSNKAALEMSDRIAARNKDAAVAMWIGTFHAFGLDVVRRFYEELGYTKDPQLRNRTEAVELLEHEFPTLKLKHFRDLRDPTDDIQEILDAISRAKDEVVGPTEYTALAEAMIAKSTDATRKTAEKQLDVARAYVAYEGFKRKANCLDFGDLVYLPVKLLEENVQILEQFRARYEHVLVDEYQDVNRSSIRLLMALTKGGTNLWVVGDPRQLIYRFRGASSFNVSRFGETDFPGGIKKSLELNFRSTPEIVAAFSVFASGMSVGAPEKPYRAYRSSLSAPPELRLSETADSLTGVLADSIEELRRKGVAYKFQAVLCSGNDTLVRIGTELERLGIPVLFLGSLFERPEIRHLLSLLSLLCDTRASGLVNVCADKAFPLSLSEVARIIDYLRANERPPMEWARDKTLVEQLSPSGQKTATDLESVLRGFTASSSPWEVLSSYLLDRSRTVAAFASCPDAATQARGVAIWQFLNFIRVQPAAAGEPVARLLIRVRRLIRLGDDTELRDLPAAAQHLDAVRLLTVHRSKGLEFPAVHLFGVHDRVFPGIFSTPGYVPPDGLITGATGGALDALRAENQQERECLFFVALSRAQDHLRLYSSTKTKGDRVQTLSKFVDRLGFSLGPGVVSTARKLPPLIEDVPVPLKLEGALRFTDYQLGDFDRCPRMFLYETIMRVGGRRTPTPFLQMHEAVRKVIVKVLDGKDSELGGLLDHEFKEIGLAEHGYASDYRAFALPMLEYLRDIRAGKKSIKTDPLTLQFGEEFVVVSPHELIEDIDGTQTLRSIRTGSKTKASLENLAAATLLLVGEKFFPKAGVELVFLNDRSRERINLKGRMLENRKDTMTEIFGAVRQGNFPVNPDDHCARCSALFFCGALPAGELAKKL